MGRNRSRDADEILVSADVLGSFGVTPDDVRAQRREYHTVVPPGQEERSLESILADVLADARDRTATIRRLICRSDRGLSCSARYAQRALGRELAAVFESIGWSLEWTRTGPAENGRDRLALTATDPKGRERETTVTYPETPLADDNLPAVLRAVDERLLAGTDATVVLLSTGVDRWRAALIETDELEALRDRYGERIAAFDRPLLPDHDLEAFVPDDDEDRIDPAEATPSDPWPAWALERAKRRSERRSTVDAVEADSVTDAADEPITDTDDEPVADAEDERSSVADLIDEAEPESASADPADSAAPSTSAPSASSPSSSRQSTSASSASTSSTSAPSTEAGGFEIRGGSPSVSRVRDDSSTDPSPRDVADSILEDQRERTAGSDTDDRNDPRPDDADTGDTNGAGKDDDSSADDDADDGFGTLSGSVQTTRVTNDSFGTDESFETEDDRYRALGAALGAGGAVSVEGLLEDDEFLPELPAAESETVRIEFEETFDPADVPEATASAEQSGFEWVDSGSLKTTRRPNQ